MMFENISTSIKNKARNFLIKKGPKKYYLERYPKDITIEMTNLCTIHCTVCNIPDLKRKKGKMSFENFKKIIKKLPDTVERIYMNWSGEPLINKDIWKMIKYAKTKREIKTWISTNGTLLGEYSPDEILDSEVEELAICIDGATKEQHESYREGSNFDEIIKNTKKICQRKKERGIEEGPLIIMQTLIKKDNQNSIPEIKKLAKELSVDRLDLRYFNIRGLSGNRAFEKKVYPYLHYLTDEEFKERGENHIPKKEYSAYVKENGEWKIKNPGDCLAFLHMVIAWNGDVILCCNDPDGNHTFGNILEEDFQKIFKRLPREKILNRDFDVCNLCTIMEDINYAQIKKEDL